MTYTAHQFTQFANSGKAGPTMTTDAWRVVLSGGTYATVSAGMAAIQDTAATMTAVKAASGWTEMTTAQGGSNYVANANSTSSGVALSGLSYTQSGHVYTWTCTAPTWTTAAAAFNPCIAVFFDATGGTDLLNIPICFWDFGANMAGTGGSYTLTPNASGIFTATGS